MSRVLTIVGASARAAAQSSVRAGFSIHAADLFADTDLRSLGPATAVADYPAGLAKVIAGPHSGGWLYSGGLENHPRLVDAWARQRPLLGNCGEVLDRVRHPQLVSAALDRAGLPSPAVAFDADELRGPAQWLRKSLRSAGGSHVEYFNPHDAAHRAATECYFQQFVEGRAYSAVYVAARGSAVRLGITRQLVGARWTGARDFQYCGSIGPLAVPSPIEHQFDALGSLLAREFDLVGLFGVDAIVNASGVWPVEVNPRYTASVEVLEWAQNMRAIAMHVAACEGGHLPTPVRRMPRLCGKAILFADGQFVIPEEFSQSIAPAELEPWPSVADVPDAGTTIQLGWPIVTVLAEASDEPMVLARLRQQSARIRSLLAV